MISHHGELLGEGHGAGDIAEGMDGLRGHKPYPITSSCWPHQLLLRPRGSLAQRSGSCNK